MIFSFKSIGVLAVLICGICIGVKVAPFIESVDEGLQAASQIRNQVETASNLFNFFD